MTMQNKFLAMLIKRGEKEIKRLTGCIVVTCKEGGYYYLGSSGSLRHGGTRTGSIPVRSKFKEKLLTEFVE